MEERIPPEQEEALRKIEILSEKLEEQNLKIEEQEAELAELRSEYARVREMYTKNKRRLDMITHSRSYKLVRILQRIKAFITRPFHRKKKAAAGAYSTVAPIDFSHSFLILTFSSSSSADFESSRSLSAP